MKKYVLLFTAVLALCSCEKGDPTPQGSSVPAEGGSVVELSFGADVESRAFGSGASESWEKEVKTATVLIFNAATEEMLFRRDLTAAEIGAITTTPISLIVQGGAVGASCDFVVVANRQVPMSISSKSTLLAELETDGVSYNGTFAEVTSKSKRSGGFAMSGMAAQTISSAGNTAVTVVLKRTVAKVEIVARTTAAFAQKYGNATITIDKARLSQVASSCYLLDRSAYPGGNDDSCEQNAVSGRNLFYVFERAASAAGSRVKLTLDAVYDADGSAATTSDRVGVTYDVELTGAANGQILRNGAYLVNVNIDGLMGSDVNATITVADWESLITQNVNVGK